MANQKRVCTPKSPLWRLLGQIARFPRETALLNGRRPVVRQEGRSGPPEVSGPRWKFSPKQSCRSSCLHGQRGWIPAFGG